MREVSFYPHCSGKFIAQVEEGQSGHVIITWSDINLKTQGIQCDGWLEDGHLFAPTDGSLAPGIAITDKGIPDPIFGWYCVETGSNAVYGLPGSTLSVLAGMDNL